MGNCGNCFSVCRQDDNLDLDHKPINLSLSDETDRAAYSAFY
jgi:hypothetical protein